MKSLLQLLEIHSASAAESGSVTGGSVTLFNPLGPDGPQTLMELITKIADIMIGVGIALAVIMVLYGAYQMMFSAGDPKKFGDGQKTIMYTAIGLAVLLLAKGLVGVVYGILKGI